MMTTPGVGPVVALTYRATVDVPARFRKSKAVGAVFGLTCAKYQSGELDRNGRISRCGDGTTTVSACPYACDGTPMTVRGGGIPRRPLAPTPNGRMGPPLRSFAADAHDCIMVRVLGPTGYKVVARLNRAPKAGSPLIVIATALSVPSCSKPSRYGLARRSMPQGWCDGQS